MLDIGWSELVLIGVVALIFVGPKDLPRMFHALGRFTAKARGMAREFQRAMDDAAKTSGLDEVRKDLGGVKAGISAATNPTGYGINALEDAARKFENWDPKSVLKPAAAPSVAGGAVVTVGSGSAVAGTAAGTAVSSAPDAAVSSSGVSGSAASGSASEAVSGAVSGAGPETKALAEKRAADAAAARAKAYELQAKASQSVTATFAARAKADAEAAAAKQAQADAEAARMADESAAAPSPKPRVRAKKADAAPVSAGVEAETAKPVRKPPVRRKKSDA